MSVMNRPENVRSQYSDDRNLTARIRLHNRYSVNPQGYVPWLFEQYRFQPGFRILELGCGNAHQWGETLERLPASCALTLTDLSEGMVDAVRLRHASRENVSIRQADICNIPFPDARFDAVIANHMLYHVPNLDRALEEVDRVLRPGGRFYAATNGDNGLHAWLNRALKAVNPDLDAFEAASPFSLQNGGEIMGRRFPYVERRDYRDALNVTDARDLMDWIRSALSISRLEERNLDGLLEFFEAIRVRDGVIHIPKEAGLFIASREAVI